MMVCLFWCIFFCIRYMQGMDEPRVKGTILLFYIAATILYFDHWMYFSGVPSGLGEWSYTIVNLCVYPLYYAYLRALTRERKSYELLFLLLPAVLAFAVFPVLRHIGLLTTDATFLIIRLCFMVQVIWALVRGYRLLHRTILRMDNTYSDDRSRLLQPTRILLVLFGATSAVSIILNLIGRDYFAHDIHVAVPAVVMSVLLFGLGYVAAHTTIPPESVPQEEEETKDGEGEEDQNLIHHIDSVMQDKKLYTNPNLTIQDLAAEVNSNRTYVSRAINRTYGISFSQYVARQRVTYAMHILCDPQYTTDKSAIADAVVLSGFSSDQNFYRVFKEIAGTTPLQYRKSKS
jgi:AraC-like DNA-binding protein